MPSGLSVELTIGGVDFSHLFMRCHSEQTTNASKDENKYDITLANGGGQLFLPFKPKDAIELNVINNRKTCEYDFPDSIHIFTGEVQKISVDELECHIEGSCMQGGMITTVSDPVTWSPGTTIETQVLTLLDMFGYDTSKAYIDKANMNNISGKHTPDVRDAKDFNTAMKELGDEAGCNFFFDEFGVFYFVTPLFQRGYRYLDGHVLKGQQASNMSGLCTIVDVYGWSYTTPENPASSNFAHQKIHARVRADDPRVVTLMQGEDMIANYGEVLAPPIIRPNIDQPTADKLAYNAMLWFLQFKDVPQVKVEGIAPYLYSIVGYSPFNGENVPLACETEGVDLDLGIVAGQVVKRVIEISPEIGLNCLLDLNVRWQAAEGMENIVAENMRQFTSNPYPDVFDVED